MTIDKKTERQSIEIRVSEKTIHGFLLRDKRSTHLFIIREEQS